MAPNPNERVILQLNSNTPATSSVDMSQVVAAAAAIKIVTTSSDESEDGEHFYDASSDIGGHVSDDSNSSGAQEGSNETNCSKASADSGMEDGSFEVPDDQLAAQIVEQVEYYFSDAHILKDAFLLKHARRNRDGFISLKLITSFKKVKHVTKDWRVVAYACKTFSKELEVNEVGTKVRRVAPLPETDETSPSRTVVVIGLAPEKATIEAMAEMFSAHLQSSGGSIGLIRILRPGNTIPPDVRQCANRHADILTSICAVVEFEQAETARTAIRDAPGMVPSGVRLVELAARRGAGSSRTSPNTSRPVTPSSQPNSEANTPNNRRRRRVVTPSSGSGSSSNNNNNNKALGQQQQDHEGETPRSPYLRRPHQESNSSSPFATPAPSPQQRRHLPAHVTGRPITPRQTSPELNGRPKSSSVCDSNNGNNSSSSQASPGSSPPGSCHSPWVRRRLDLAASAAANGFESGRSSPLCDNRLSIPSNIVRMPNGPDGTRGFHSHLLQGGKPRSASAPEAPLMVPLCSF